MARPGFLRHKKFGRLARSVGSKALALGSIEMIWEVAYENGDADVGTADDVEWSAEWAGEKGALARALVEAGLIDVTECDGEVRYVVHDLLDHAPEYVWDRKGKEEERRKSKKCAECGRDYRSSDKRAKYCSQACRQASYRHGKTDSDAGVTDEQSPATDRYGPPAPAPAPAPAPLVETLPPAREVATAPEEGPSPALMRLRAVGSTWPRSVDLVDALEAGGWVTSLPKDNVGRGALEKSLETVPVARAAEALLLLHARDPSAKPWLGWHLDLIAELGKTKAPAVGDLGTNLDPWWGRLEPEQRDTYLRERTAIDPELEGAPFGLTGTAHTAEVEALNEKWARIARGAA